MPLSTDLFNSQKEEYTLSYLGTEFKVFYNPSAYTGDLIAKSMDMGVYDYLPKILVGWEVLYGEKDTRVPEKMRGKPVPLTAEALRGLPLPFLQYVNRAITALMVPNADTPPS